MAIADETGTIVLGGVKYGVHAFTLDELQQVIPLITAYHAATFKGWTAQALATSETIVIAKDILAVALRKPVEEVGGIAATADEVLTAIDTISRIAGLVSLGELIARMMPPGTSIGIGSTPTS